MIMSMDMGNILFIKERNLLEGSGIMAGLNLKLKSQKRKRKREEGLMWLEMIKITKYLMEISILKKMNV
jgi:hypothetical protein